MDHEQRTRLDNVIDSRSVVLVEGLSDQLALQTLAEQLGRDFEAERVSILAMGGASFVSRFLHLLGPAGRDLELAGLCDAAEEAVFARGLERAGIGSDLDRSRMEALGFFVCVEDLEDELIRALEPTGVEEIIESEGEMPTFRRFQSQPAQRDRPIEKQLHRFLGTRSGRKIRFAGLMVGALPLERMPQPLIGLMEHV